MPIDVMPMLIASIETMQGMSWCEEIVVLLSWCLAIFTVAQKGWQAADAEGSATVSPLSCPSLS